MARSMSINEAVPWASDCEHLEVECASCGKYLGFAHERSAGAAPPCDCVELKAKLHLAVTALRGFEALYTEIIEGKEPSDDD